MTNPIRAQIRWTATTFTLVFGLFGALWGAHTAMAQQPAPTAMPAPVNTAATDAMSHTAHAGGATISSTITSTTTVTGALYEDDFTNTASGWPNALEFDNYYIGYHEPTFFHIEVRTPRDKAMVMLPNKTFGDATFESKVLTHPNNTAQTGDFRYGLAFRRSGNQFYAFVISPRTKTWYLLKSSPTGVTELMKGLSDSIQGLTAPDTLRVDANGPAFSLHVNDQLVGQASDADYSSGAAGFLVETFDSPRAHIHYDTFSVRDVEVQPAQCTVISSGLNIREGPGVIYRIIGTARQGTVARPLARSADGNWINILLPGRQQSAWVSGAPIYVGCNVAIRDLAVRQPEPLPSP